MESKEITKTNATTKAKKIDIRFILVVVFILLYAIFNYCNIRAEYLYNLELGAQYVEKFMQNLQYNVIIFLFSFVFLFLLIYIITVFIKRGLKKFFIEEKKEMPKLPNKSLSLVISAILTILVLPEISSKIILSLNATSFEITDQIFNMDIGYYIFNQPVIEMMLRYIILTGIVLIVYIAVYYIATLNIYFDGVDIESLKKNTVVKLLITILVVITLAISGSVFIKSSDVLFTNFLNLNNDFALVGAGAVDILLKIWGFRILAIMILLSVFLIIKNIKNGNRSKAFKAVLIVPIYLISLFILMIGYQYIFVNQNKLDTEYDYIKNNIESTRNAYNIKVEENELNYSGTVNYNEVQNNKDIVDNIPVVDENITLTTLNEYQNKQGYYLYKNTKLLKYNNELVYVTPREIVNSNVTSKINKTYEYTHGFGTIITSATKLNNESGIEYLQSDFESNKETDFVNITQPRIYFGLETNNVIVTDSKEKQEFDYPITTTQVVNNVYDGKAGLKLGFFDKLILSIKEGNMGILFGSGQNENSKILVNRNILLRVKSILPDLIYDENPYLVVTDEGKLVWVIDGYTVSDKYPYSNSTTITVEGSKRTINYIRNSVKVLVDAYDGTVSYYITDRNDPIIMAYKKIYPSIFMDINEKIPADINEHIVYPEFLYNIQSEMLNVYHNVKPEVLYRNDDIWEIATYQFSSTTNKVTTMSPNYTLVSYQNDNDENVGENVGAKENSLALVIPYTIEGKQNLNAYLMGYYDKNSNENKLVLNKFNSENGILGPKQLERQINENTAILKELEEVTLAGSKIVKNLYVIPIENTILYVEPIYQVLVNESPVPILKKVIVSSGNKLAIGETLDKAIQNLLSQYAVDIEDENNDDIEAVIESIIKANKNLKSSSESNNWTLMGQDIEKLQKLIEILENLKIEQDKKDNKNPITQNIVVSNDLII